MFYYYEIDGKAGFGTERFEELREITEQQCRAMLEDPESILFFVKKTDASKRTSYSIVDASMIFEDGDNLEIIRTNHRDKIDISSVPFWMIEKIEQRRVRYINMAHKNY